MELSIVRDPRFHPAHDFAVCPAVGGASRPTMFTDRMWQLPPNSSDGGRLNTARIDWAAKLPDGTLFTDPEHAELLFSCKCFLWSVWSPLGHKSNGATSTCIKAWTNLRRLVVWMVNENIHAFAKLEQLDLDAFLDDLRESNLKKGPLSLAITVLWQLFRAGPHVPDNLRFEPFEGRSAQDVVDYIPRRDIENNHALPDELIQPLFLAAKKWASEYGPGILKHLRRLEKVRNSPPHSAIRKTWARDKAEGRLRCISITGEEWRTPLRTHNDLVNVEGRLIAACYTLVAGFSGMRVHEVSEIRPGCISRPVTVENGAWEMFTVRSRSKKVEGQKEGRIRDWIVGGRPAGTDSSIWSIDALKIMHQHHAIRGAKCKFLFSTAGTQFGLRNPLITKWLNRLSPEAAPGIPHHISTHQFRRTYAKWCIRYNSNAGGALLQQFGHLNTAWLIGYTGRNPDLEAVFAEEKAEHVAETLVAMMTEPVAGPSAASVRKEKLELLATFKQPDDFARFISSAAKRKDLTLVHTEWGVCYYARSAAACSGGSSGPDLVARNAGLCSTCPNLRVLPRHRVYHEQRIANARQSLASYPKATAFLTDEWNRRIQQSQEILEQLTEEKIA